MSKKKVTKKKATKNKTTKKKPSKKKSMEDGIKNPDNNQLFEIPQAGEMVFHKKVKEYGSLGEKAVGHVQANAPKEYEFVSFCLGGTKINEPITVETAKKRMIGSFSWVGLDDVEEALTGKQYEKVLNHLCKKYPGLKRTES